jgi:asparagine synthase (glutamine-hydrolysing)
MVLPPPQHLREKRPAMPPRPEHLSARTHAVAALAGLWRTDVDAAGEACAAMLSAQPGFAAASPHIVTLAPVAFGARSLAGETSRSAPVVGRGGRLLLAADARLDNRNELIAALGLDAASPRASSDAGLICAAWEEWDEDCLPRLLGDFAIAAWDADRRALVLARDIAGGRPLHYHVSSRIVAFASLARGLHVLAEVPRAPDLAFIREALARGMPGAGGSWYTDVARVPPGHLVRASAAGHSVERWWDPRPPAQRPRSGAAYAEALLAHLDEAVACRMDGGDRAAAHLSAGYDSGAVATSAAIQLPAGGRLNAFTAVPRPGYACGDRFVDEGPGAAAVAALYPNMEHVLVGADGRSILRQLESWSALMDQPVPNPCNMPWIGAVADAARERGFSSLLTGQYGNLGFSYDGLPWLSELFRRGRWLRLGLEVLRVRSRGGRPLRHPVGAALGPSLRHWRARRAGNRPEPLPRDARTMRLDFFARTDLGAFWRGIYVATGIEHRDATADRRLLEFTLDVPDAEYLRGGFPRSLARRALAGRLPPEILTESRRGVQAADWHEGAAAEHAQLAAELDLIAACPAAAEVLDLDSMRSRLAAWPSDGWDRTPTILAYRAGLLRELSLGHFMRKACG